MPTRRGKQILDFVSQYKTRHGYSPSFAEIKKYLGLSSFSTIHYHVNNLEKEGLIMREKNQRRAIRTGNNPSDLVQIRLLGSIAAGEPIEVFEDYETISVPKTNLSNSGEHFALKVCGNSMIEEGIQDQDTVIIKKQPSVDNGETAVALINGNEVTLKKIYREKNSFRLQPANSTLKPIYTRKLTIQGKVISVIRNFDTDNKALHQHKEKACKPAQEQSNHIDRYTDKIFPGDVMELLKKLPDNSVDMVFGDPDYNVGVKYGDRKYTKNFEDYISWYIELTKESMRVLKADGNLFMMNYPKQNAHLRVKYLDDHFPLVFEYVWVYNTNVGHSNKRFTTAHRTIFHVLKAKHNRFYKDQVALPYQNPTDRRIQQNLRNGSKGRMPYSWFYFDLVKNVSREKTYHACQIPQKLTEMLVKACTRPKDIALILFGGSGAELEVCKNLDRKFISAEIDPKYREIIADRLKNGCISKKHKLKLRKEKETQIPEGTLFNVMK